MEKVEDEKNPHPKNENQAKTKAPKSADIELATEKKDCPNEKLGDLLALQKKPAKESGEMNQEEALENLPIGQYQVWENTNSTTVHERGAAYGQANLAKPYEGQWAFGTPELAKAGAEQGIETQGLLREAEVAAMLALVKAKHIGPVLGKALIAYFGDAQSVFRAKAAQLQRISGVGPRLAAAIGESGLLEKGKRLLETAQKQGVELLIWGEGLYPKHLKEIYDSPLVLFAKGHGSLLAKPSIAIVGTRTPTSYGKEIAAHFAAGFAAAGVNIVSGLAYGIDYEAHHSVVRCGGQTTAVLGHGLDLIYPAKHAKLADEIMEKGNLLSEFPFGVGPEACNFPARNRIISGLCSGIVVVEAAETGGALITARVGFEQDRAVFAVPGDIKRRTSVGCNRLIRDNIAKLVMDPEEVLEELSFAWLEMGQPNGKRDREGMPRGARWLARMEDLEPGERQLVEAIDRGNHGSATVPALDAQLGIGLPSLQLLLLGLEFKGIIRNLPGGKVELI